MLSSSGESVYWQLFRDVRPLFAADIPWTVQRDTQGSVSAEIAVENAGFFIKACMQETPLHIQKDHFDTIDGFISFIADDLRTFLYELEFLVQDNILHGVESDQENCPDKKIPRLNALGCRLRRSPPDAFDINHYLRFICLSQNPSRLSKICTGIENINKKLAVETNRTKPDGSAVPKIKTVPVSCADDSTSWFQATFSPTFWTSSQKLFEVLLSKFRACTLPAHSIMLNLRGLGPSHSQDGRAEFDLLFPACPSQDSWQAVLCQVLDESPLDPESNDDLLPENICEAVNVANNYGTMLYIRVHEKDLWYECCEDHQPAYPEALPTITMSQLIEDGHLKDLRGFHLKDRWILALNLAQSLLQFHDGPWLQQLWTSENIFLLYENGQGRKLRDIHNSFISCMISDSPPSLPKPTHYDRYPLLLTFGQFLLELANGEKLPVITTKDGQVSPYRTLMHNFNELNTGSLSDDYKSAIEACLKFHKLLKDEKAIEEELRVRTTIFKNIVQPLERNLRSFTSDWVSANAQKLNIKRKRPFLKNLGSRDWHLEDKTPSTVPPLSGTASSRAHSNTLLSRAEVAQVKPLNSSDHSLSILNIEIHSQPIQKQIDNRNTSSKSDSDSEFDEVEGILLGSFDTKPSEVEEYTSLQWGETFQRLSRTYSSHFQHKLSDEPVKVAILDTGMDFSHPDLQKSRSKSRKGNVVSPVKGELAQIERIKECQNFCDDLEANDVTDLDGHGTHIAGIILQLAPTAELYIARVCQGAASSDNGLSPHVVDALSGKLKPSTRAQRVDPQRVESAVRWAIGHGIHLINMSFGYQNPDPKLDEALREATNLGIVVFAAASNFGNHEEVAWPARDPSRAICVHSSNDLGTQRSDFSPNPDVRTVNFMAIGEQICSYRLVNKGGGYQRMSGTSMATPVTTAVAALLLAFVRQSVVDEKKKQEVEDEIGSVELLELSRMRASLKQICKEVQPNYYWIHPRLLWREYNRARKQADDPIAASRHAWEELRKALKR